MNIVERVYTTGVCASGGYEARLVDKDGDVWAVKSFYPDDYFVCDIRGEANVVTFLKTVVDKKKGLTG